MAMLALLAAAVTARAVLAAEQRPTSSRVAAAAAAAVRQYEEVQGAFASSTSPLVAAAAARRRSAPDVDGDGLNNKAAPSSSAPNIVFIMVDDWGYNNVGWHAKDNAAGAEISTPVLDSLAEEGLLLDSYYAFQYCSPSRSSFMTGCVGYTCVGGGDGVCARKERRSRPLAAPSPQFSPPPFSLPRHAAATPSTSTS
jgi:type II secretory pathway pseudopilin PulG